MTTLSHNLIKGGAVFSGLLVQGRVILALILRDPTARFGHENLGFFWIVGEPMLLTTGVIVVWTLLGATHGHNVPIAVFGLTGYSLITIWRHIVFRSIRAISAVAHIAYHRHVKRIDMMVAWAVVELTGILSGFFITLAALWLYDDQIVLRDPLQVLIGFIMAAWFSLAFGLILAGMSEISEMAHHLVQPVMYLTLPLTGIFTMVAWLPPAAQRVMSYSPLVNCVEMIRGGIMSPEIETHWDFGYLLICCCIATAIGLPLFRFGERFVES